MAELGVQVHFDLLAEQLGPTLAAFLSNAEDATGRGADPATLQAAREVWETLVAIHHPHTARSWLIAANPRLAGHAPVERLRDGDRRAVILAARAFIGIEAMGS